MGQRLPPAPVVLPVQRGINQRPLMVEAVGALGEKYLQPRPLGVGQVGGIAGGLEFYPFHPSISPPRLLQRRPSAHPSPCCGSR